MSHLRGIGSCRARVNIPPKADEDFFSAIGRLTISWAHLELGLDLVVDTTHRLKLRKELEKPRALQRKISYMRASIKQMPLPEDALTGFENLFSTIEAAAEIRHDIIHGAIGMHQEGGDDATFFRLLRRFDPPRTREKTYSTIDILKAAVEAQHLSGIVLNWGLEFHKLLPGLKPPNDEQSQS
jgi:hypothetical protein